MILLNLAYIPDKVILDDNFNFESGWQVKFKQEMEKFKSEFNDNLYKDKNGKVLGYCKKCQCSKPRSAAYKERRVRYAYKYNCTCKVCGAEFMGYKMNQYSCSRRCHFIRLNGSVMAPFNT